VSFTEEQINAACEKNGWVRTGVFATEEETERARQWRAEMDEAPVAKILGHWLHEDAEALFKRRIDELAMAHGLPDRGEDHYGIIVTGEFTTERKS